jgi:uncharacterized protein YkwD
VSEWSAAEIRAADDVCRSQGWAPPVSNQPQYSAIYRRIETDVLPTTENLELVRAAILCLHNQIRQQNNLPLLKDNLKLRKAAVGHSADMVGEGFFDHTSPNGDSFVDRILDAGYAKRNDGWTLGENLAWGTGDLSSAKGVMDAWMNSAGHKANILKRAYKEVGIGIKLGVPSDDGVGATIPADFGVKL